MKLSKLLFGAAALLAPFVAAESAEAESETFQYESDIARLRSLVIHSLYSHKDVFLRELLSNANDALEKLRITALTDRSVLDAGAANITIEVFPNEDGESGRLVVRDTGNGMSKSELAKNLGTIARSGTSEFLKQAEDSGGADGNLIGQFGLGFYSCFLVSPTVRVSSLPPATAENPNPVQYTFVSSAKGDSFEVFPDPRGNMLGRGTEIVLDIQPENKEFLSTNTLKALIDKHSAFSTTFPIYVREEVPEAPKNKDAEDEDDEDDQGPEQVWTRVNDNAPIWMREPADVSKEDYIDFYRAVSKEPDATPLGWSHFKGDTASGVSYRAIMYIPAKLAPDFWNKVTSGVNNVRLMVKRVFITDDLGASYMPRWLSFLKVTVDADDLPLNVSRETLQNHRFLKQLQRILVRKALDLFTRLAADEPEKFKEVSKMYGNALRIGLIESPKDKTKIAKLLRFESTKSGYTSLEEYVERRKEGQKQVYFMAGVGEKPEDLTRSPFVEKLKARGYEVLLLTLPSDEPMMGVLQNFMGLDMQDVAKKGLVYGDEEEDAAEKAELEAATQTFEPLTSWLKTLFKGQVSDVVLTNRLVTSPCTIVVDSMGWSANMARLMAAQADAENDPMYHMLKNLPRVLEINPKAPLIESMLSHVLDLAPADDEESVSADEEELRETARVLFATTLVRSGFDVPDVAEYFDRVESLLRRSLGVSLSAKTDDTVRPAPPTASEALKTEDEAEAEDEDDEEHEAAKPSSEPVMNDDDFMDWAEFKRSIGHDEL